MQNEVPQPSASLPTLPACWRCTAPSMAHCFAHGARHLHAGVVAQSAPRRKPRRVETSLVKRLQPPPTSGVLSCPISGGWCACTGPAWFRGWECLSARTAAWLVPCDYTHLHQLGLVNRLVIPKSQPGATMPQLSLPRPAAPTRTLSTAPSTDGKRFAGISPEQCFTPDWLAKDKWGYCVATNGKGGKSRGHRLAYRVFVGEIPSGLMVLHRCGNEACINPHHLYLGDAWQNAQDRVLHGTNASATGASLPQTKLTEADVLAIRASGESCIELAKRYGMSRSYIWRVRVGDARLNKSEVQA